MKIDILTIFPEYFESPLKCGLLSKAVEKGVISLNPVDIRGFAPDGHVDDRPFGGGSGMVFKVEPIYKAAKSVMTEGSSVVVLTPSGERFNQKIAVELSKEKHIVIISGRYEGIDGRVAEILNAREISLGDFVLSGGEAAALAVIEAVSRLIPGFVGNPESIKDESFDENGLIEYPQYTRPCDFNGYRVPEVLLSGNHENIKKFREGSKRKAEHERRI
ncbi:MAG: tRNA (guanosine(37)-N1)-methyltransferase TrmD [bacterium]